MYQNAIHIRISWCNKSCWFPVKKCWCQHNLTGVLIYAKFHHCRICVTDFKKGSILSLTTHEKSLKDPCWKALSRARLFLIIKNGCWNWKYILPRFGGLFHWQEKQFSYASSIRSQAIEAFWSRLKRFETFWWIDFFTGMTLKSTLKSKNKLHKELFLFLFLPILQKELNEFLMTWNSRKVRHWRRLQVEYMSCCFKYVVLWVCKN